MPKRRRINPNLKPSTTQEPSVVSSSSEPLAWPATVVLCLLMLTPLLFGSFIIYHTVVQPRRLATAADSWIEVPCLLRRVEIESHSLSGAGKQKPVTVSTAYSPLVEYDYQWQGKEYASTRFWLGNTLWNSRQDVKEILEPYRLTNVQSCFVDPTDPTQAVLTRELFLRPFVRGTTLMWFGLVSSLIIGGIVVLNRTMGRSRIDPSAEPETKAMPDAPGSEDVAVSAARASHLWIAALVWNGILWTIAWFSWVGGAPLSFFIVFLGIFWLIGLALIAGALLTTIRGHSV